MRCDRRSFLLLAAAGSAGFFAGGRLRGQDIEFRDVESQAKQFMRWYADIRLTPSQERVKKAALEPLPAPCCSDNSAYTCCCECNISRTIWGLSQYMIAKQSASAEQVRAKVREWIAFIAPRGHKGSSCYEGGCARPFNQDGCGGMSATRLVL